MSLKHRYPHDISRSAYSKGDITRVRWRGKPSGLGENNDDNSKNPKIASFRGSKEKEQKRKARYSFFPITDRPDTHIIVAL